MTKTKATITTIKENNNSLGGNIEIIIKIITLQMQVIFKEQVEVLNLVNKEESSTRIKTLSYFKQELSKSSNIKI